MVGSGPPTHDRVDIGADFSNIIFEADQCAAACDAGLRSEWGTYGFMNYSWTFPVNFNKKFLSMSFVIICAD